MAKTLWAFAVFDKSPPRAVVDAAAARAATEFSEQELGQCFLAHLGEAAAGRTLGLPKELLELGEVAWRGRVDSTVATRFRINVCDSLTRLGVEYAVEGATMDGLLRTDILLLGNVALEVDSGVAEFTSTNHT